jgi:hypothetical protein
MESPSTEHAVHRIRQVRGPVSHFVTRGLMRSRPYSNLDELLHKIYYKSNIFAFNAAAKLMDFRVLHRPPPPHQRMYLWVSKQKRTRTISLIALTDRYFCRRCGVVCDVGTQFYFEEFQTWKRIIWTLLSQWRPKENSSYTEVARECNFKY